MAHSEAMNAPGGGAHVDVELADRAVHRQQIERPQCADLIHPAGEAAAAEHERGLIAPRPAPAVDRRRFTDARGAIPRLRRGLARRRRAALGRRRALDRRFQLDNLAHARFILRLLAPESPPLAWPCPVPRACPARRAACRSRQDGRRALLSAALCACLLRPWQRLPQAVVEPAASASGESARLQADLGHQLALAGPADGAYVYDLTAHQALFSERAQTPRPPASVEKLYTATTALERMGAARPPEHDRLRNRQAHPRGRMGRQPVPARRRRPDVRLERVHPLALRRHRHVGLGARHCARAQRRHPPHHRVALRRRVLPRLAARRALERLSHPTRSSKAPCRGSPSTAAETGSASPLAPHAPAAYAAHELLASLKGDGVSIAGHSGAATTPAGASQLAQVAVAHGDPAAGPDAAAV